MTNRNRDQVFSEPRSQTSAFEFNEEVAEVFEDMIDRSVPGYRFFLETTALLARRHARSGTNCYDLGCSLGAASLAIISQAPEGCRVIAIDTSPDMVSRCRGNLAAKAPDALVEVRQQSIQDTSITQASLVTLNFTLQFIPDPVRLDVLARIYEGLCDGGALLHGGNPFWE